MQPPPTITTSAVAFIAIPDALPDDLDGPRLADRPVARDEWQTKVARDCDDEGIEGIASKTQFARDHAVLAGDVQRLIRGVAEQVVEERACRPAQVDANRARQQNDLPHHDGG